MLLIGIPILVAVGVFILTWRIDGFYEIGLNLFASFISGFVALCLVGISCLFAGTMLPATETYTEPIYALNDISSSFGSYFITYGAEDSTLKYYYIVDTADGRTVTSANMSNSHFQYITPDEEPCVKHIGKTMPWWLAPGKDWIETKTIFYIPEGAVTTDINVDLQ